MKKRFSIVMIAAILCMCIPVIGPHAYAEEGDPMQEPVYMEDGKSVQEPADAEEKEPVLDPASGDGTESDSRDLTAPSNEGNDDTETFIKRAAFAIVITIKIRRSRY